jgi:hypothetical protein
VARWWVFRENRDKGSGSSAGVFRSHSRREIEQSTGSAIHLPRKEVAAESRQASKSFEARTR